MEGKPRGGVLIVMGDDDGNGEEEAEEGEVNWEEEAPESTYDVEDEGEGCEGFFGGSLLISRNLASFAALCSAKRVSKALLRPLTLRRADRLCDLQVNDRVQGVNLLPSSDTPQCLSGS